VRDALVGDNHKMGFCTFFRIRHLAGEQRLEFFLGHTRAPLVLLPLEDALGVEQQANLPGTSTEHPNWRRRLPARFDGLFAGPEIARIAALIAAARRQAAQ